MTLDEQIIVAALMATLGELALVIALVVIL